MLLSGCRQAFRQQSGLQSEVCAVLCRAKLQRRYYFRQRLDLRYRDDQVIKASTWYTSHPSQVSSNSVHISKIFEQLAYSCRHPELHTAVIFATPSLTHLFDIDNDFVHRLVQRLLFNSSSEKIEASAPASSTIRIRLAIVDRLPADTELNLRPQNSSRGIEGFSVLALGANHRSLRAEYAEPESESSSSNAHVRFVLQKGNHEKRVIALPVANTTFRNGRQSTSYEEIWQVTTQRGMHPRWERRSRKPLKSFEIAMTRGDSPHFIAIPMLTLTPPCEIGSSIGNVLRQLKRTDTGELFPASTDLEVAVTKFLKSSWLTEKARSGFAVFALITCNDFHARSSKATRAGVNPPGRWSVLNGLFSGGARLHRVTGGGGGWGNKKGLLSFEPGVDLFADKQDLLPSLPPEGEKYDFQGAAALASPGDNVQFLAVVPGQQGPEIVPEASEEAGGDSLEDKDDITFLERETEKIVAWRNRQRNALPRMVIGTSPQDEAPPSTSDNLSLSKDEVMHAHNFFGMLSEAGACLGRTDPSASTIDTGSETVSFTSRLDIPYTTFLAEATIGLSPLNSGNAAEVSHDNTRTRSVYRLIPSRRER